VLNYLRKRRDYFAGGAMMLLGLGTIVEGSTYRLGNLRQMGPGYFPVMLGVAMTIVGVLIAISAMQPSTDPEHDEDAIPDAPEWRGWICIVAGPVLFIVLGAYFGLLPATFACVFVSALGDRTMTLKQATLLASGITISGVIIFVYLLGVAFPILRWPS